MSTSNDRRNFLIGGLAATSSALLIANRASAHTSQDSQSEPRAKNNSDDFPRDHAGPGGPVGSPSDRGKLTPGIRDSGLAPVPLTTPDLPKLPFKIVDGVKEFHLHPMPVKRELLPGQTFNFYGYNGTMPGPTIEVVDGDRVRVIVHNDLPEATTVHWHGLECPNNMDGIPFVTQPLIPAGGTYTYEFTVRQPISMMYHAHVAMQEAFGCVGMFVCHPRVAFDPAVDQDFGLLLQQFFIGPASDTADSQAMDWNYLTINGRCGPLTTPLVVKLGNRVRIRFFNFSTLHQHPLHLHGHTFWVTGTEGGRIPETAWIPGNTVIIGVAQIREFEFIANNPGDWVMHCHMFHHMMNHMVSQVGPHIRGEQFERHKHVAGFPQIMEGHMIMPMDQMKQIVSRPETLGMAKEWFKGVKGMFTVVRVLPPELYDKVQRSDKNIPAGASVFGEKPA